MKQASKKILFLLTGLILLNILVNIFDAKIDMTSDRRFSLSDTTKKVISGVEKPIQIVVFLEGDFPSYFKRLANETKNLLEDFKDQNKQIDYVFINPNDKNDSYLQSLKEKQLQPAQISVQKSGKLEQVLIYPWAIVKQGKKEIPVSLLADSFTKNIDEQIEKSIENLEYAFTNAINNIQTRKAQKIAVIKGNGELDDLHIYDFLKHLGKKYRLAPYTLDSVATQPVKTLQNLQFFDLAIIAGPTEKFNNKEKFVLDQFLMNGGKLLWMVDAVKAHKDTLMYHGKTYALNAELNLTDMFFAYGVRIKPMLVKDRKNAAPVVLKVGQVGNRPQLEQFPWFYSPLAEPNNKNAIGKNLQMVLLDFVSPIELLKNNTKKTVLLTSSPKTQLVGVPVEINFDEIGKKTNPDEFNAGIQNFGVLLEGNFKSAFNHRIKPFDIKNAKENGTSAMVIISDGDIVRNQLDKGEPLDLGFDKWSKLRYDNRQFLINTVDYLLDKSGVISLKNKEVKINFIDQNKMLTSLRTWQIINLIIPLLLLIFVGFTFNYLRKRKYTRAL